MSGQPAVSKTLRTLAERGAVSVDIANVPGVETQAEAIMEAMEPWIGGHRLPNFTMV